MGWEQRLQISSQPGSFSDLGPQGLLEPNSSRESETTFLLCPRNFAENLDIERLVGVLRSPSCWELLSPVTRLTQGFRVTHSLFLSLPLSLLFPSISIWFGDVDPGPFMFHAISLPLSHIPGELSGVLHCGREVLSVNVPNIRKHLCAYISVILLKTSFVITQKQQCATHVKKMQMLWALPGHSQPSSSHFQTLLHWRTLKKS